MLSDAIADRLTLAIDRCCDARKDQHGTLKGYSHTIGMLQGLLPDFLDDKQGRAMIAAIDKRTEAIISQSTQVQGRR